MLSTELLETAGLKREQLLSDDLTPYTKLAITATFDDLGKVVVRLKQLEAMGLRHFNLGPPLGDDPAKTVEYTNEVIRRLKGL